MFYRLQKDIYAGKWGSDVIILDAKRDKYLSLTDDAAVFFESLLQTNFNADDPHYYSQELILKNDSVLLKSVLEQYQDRGFIETCDMPVMANMVKGPLRDGGLANYRWDYKSSIASLHQTPKKSIFSTFIIVCQVNWNLYKYGIAGITSLLKTTEQRNNDFIIPTEQQLQELSDTVDIACALYPKKIWCLGWSATFVVCALKRGWRCNIAVGVQGIPFYAHAWAECNGKVINDDPIVQEYLTVLLRMPFN